MTRYRICTQRQSRPKVTTAVASYYKLVTTHILHVPYLSNVKPVALVGHWPSWHVALQFARCRNYTMSHCTEWLPIKMTFKIRLQRWFVTVHIIDNYGQRWLTITAWRLSQFSWLQVLLLNTSKALQNHYKHPKWKLALATQSTNENGEAYEKVQHAGISSVWYTMAKLPDC